MIFPGALGAGTVTVGNASDFLDTKVPPPGPVIPWGFVIPGVRMYVHTAGGKPLEGCNQKVVERMPGRIRMELHPEEKLGN